MVPVYNNSQAGRAANTTTAQQLPVKENIVTGLPQTSRIRIR